MNNVQNEDNSLPILQLCEVCKKYTDHFFCYPEIPDRNDSEMEVLTQLHDIMSEVEI